jgi:hypothetical protein
VIALLASSLALAAFTFDGHQGIAAAGAGAAARVRRG